MHYCESEAVHVPHQMYADESSSESGRFKSFAVVSGDCEQLALLRERLDEVA